jgi:vacuolar protein sorting-associated protein IST1
MGFNTNKLKVNLKLAINRIKMLAAKKSSIRENQRREIADLLRSKKTESARIKVN